MLKHISKRKLKKKKKQKSTLVTLNKNAKMQPFIPMLSLTPESLFLP